MIKKSILVVNILLILIIVSTIFSPKDLTEIIDGKPIINDSTRLRIHHRTYMSETELILDEINGKECNEIFEYLNSYEYIRTIKNVKDLEEKEMYRISMENDTGFIFQISLRGDNYLSLINENNNRAVYKVVDGKLDFSILNLHGITLENSE